MIEIRDLRFAWPGSPAGTLLLDIGTLEVAAGRSVFLHGPSGCGKSTLLALLAGVLVARPAPNAGRVALLGQDWAALPAARRDARRADHVGVIFQQFNLLPYLSVLGNVLLPARFSAHRAAQLEVGLFRAFPRLKRLDVQLATAKGQSRATLKPAVPRLTLAR